MRSSLSFRSIAAGAVILLAACGGDLPTSSAGPEFVAGDDPIAASLDEMSISAAMLGDDAAAEAYADGALAIRLGAEPTDIGVTVDGVEVRYWAVVTGIIDRGPDGAELLRRSLVAWTGAPRVTAVLRAIARSDEAAFGSESFLGDPGRANGSWNNLARGHRYLAIDGSFASVVKSIAGDCAEEGRDTRFACNLARFDIRLDGTFELVGDATDRLTIASAPDGVSGVVIRRTDGGSGGRPTINPGRPGQGRPVVPTRG